MKNKFIYFAALFITIFVGCTDDFEEINTRKDVVSEVDPAYIFNTLLQNPTRDYQRNINLYPDIYAQYWTNIFSGDSQRYGYVDGWIGIQFREFYTKNLAEENTLKKWYGNDPVYSNAMAQLDIWMCVEWARMLETWGDLPYFGAGLGEQVPYNSQEEIYYDLFKRLKSAVEKIDSADDTQYSYPANYDLIYHGDLEKWKRFGNSIRLRLAMRLSNVDKVKAKTEAIDAIASGVMVSNEDVAQIPLARAGYYDYLDKMAWFWGNNRASKTFTDLLYNQSSVGEDPRAWKWFTYKDDDDKELPDETIIQGLENGWNTIPTNALAYATINLNGGYVGFVGNGSDTYMYLPCMFYSETLFLQAEAALRGWISGDVNTLYNEGVKASMDFVGVDGTKATDYIDGLSPLVGSNEAKLKQLITQKYIANFPNGPEGWSDFRRTDYPDITLPIDGVSSSSTVAANTWVKRIRYPNNQHDLNSKNLPAAQNTIDSDRMDIRLWWDTADTKSKSKSDGLMNSNF